MNRLEPPRSIEDPRKELRALKQRFEKADAHYNILRESSESAVARWVWATAPRYHLDPLYFHDREMGVGHIVRTRPKDRGGWAAYGLASDDRIVVEYQYLEDLPGKRYATFYSETDDRILGYHFHHERSKGCINCAQLFFTGGLYPACYQQWAIRGWRSCLYVSTGGRIHSFTETFKQDDEPADRASGELRYDADGRTEVWIRSSGNAKPELHYRGEPPENPFLRICSTPA